MSVDNSSPQARWPQAQGTFAKVRDSGTTLTSAMSSLLCWLISLVSFLPVPLWTRYLDLWCWSLQYRIHLPNDSSLSKRICMIFYDFKKTIILTKGRFPLKGGNMFVWRHILLSLLAEAGIVSRDTVGTKTSQNAGSCTVWCMGENSLLSLFWSNPLSSLQKNLQ